MFLLCWMGRWGKNRSGFEGGLVVGLYLVSGWRRELTVVARV